MEYTVEEFIVLGQLMRERKLVLVARKQTMEDDKELDIIDSILRKNIAYMERKEAENSARNN